MQGEKDGCQKDLCQKGSFSVPSLLKSSPARKNWGPSKLLPQSFHRQCAGFFTVFTTSKTLIQSPQTASWERSIPTDNTLHAPSYKVNTTYVNAGGESRRMAAGTRRPNPIQHLSWVFHLTPSFQAVADSLSQFCPMLCLFVIIFQKRFSKNLPLMEIMSKQNMPGDSGIYHICCSSLLPPSF